MKILNQMKRLETILNRIEEQNTGSPEKFAKIIGVSKRQLFNILEDLRLDGLPIEYSVDLKSYIYTKKCNFILKCKIEILDEDKTTTIFGGSFLEINYSNFLKIA